MRKRILSISLCLTVIISMLASAVVSADNTEYDIITDGAVRLLGRGEVYTDGARTFNWPNAGIEFEYTGTKAEVYVQTLIPYNGDYNDVFFNVSVDDSAVPVRIALKQGWNTLHETTGTETHKIRFVRSSEAMKGTCTLSKVRIDGTNIVPAAKKDLLIEFLGDSYTVGFGNSPDYIDPPVTDIRGQNTDNWYSYTGVVSRYYDADCNVIAYSGKGAYVNSGGDKFGGTMYDNFLRCDPFINIGNMDMPNSLNMSTKALHDFKETPDLMVVFLGTNDYSGMKKADGSVTPEDFQQGYVNLLNLIRSKYPYTSILAVSKPSNCFGDEVTNAVNICGGESNRIYRLILNSWVVSGISGHPNRAEDKVIADAVITKINSIVGIFDQRKGVLEGDGLIAISADYNTNTIHAAGNTGVANENISVAVVKPNFDLKSAAGEESFSYITQETTDANGNYSLTFNVDAVQGEFAYYTNSLSMRDLKKRSFNFKSLIPKLEVTKDNEIVSTMSDIAPGDTIKLTVSGFSRGADAPSAIAVIAQYSNNKLKDVKSFDASGDSTKYGDEITGNAAVLDGTDTIKVFYWTQNEQVPLAGTYKID